MLRAWRFDYSAWAGNFIWAAKETRRLIEQSSIPEGTLDFSSPNGKRLNPLCLEPACYVFKKVGLGAPGRLEKPLACSGLN